MASPPLEMYLGGRKSEFKCVRLRYISSRIQGGGGVRAGSARPPARAPARPPARPVACLPARRSSAYPPGCLTARRAWVQEPQGRRCTQFDQVTPH